MAVSDVWPHIQVTIVSHGEHLQVRVNGVTGNMKRELSDASTLTYFDLSLIHSQAKSLAC